MTAAEYLQRAEECLKLAAGMDGGAKEKLMRMAVTWRELAEQELRPKTMRN